jgi:excisionase family DNA binding protein
VIYLTVEDVMKKYQIAQSTVYKWMSEGMPKVKMGRLTRFEAEAIDEWIRNKSA